MPTRPIRTVRHHMALVEAAVADYAEALWAATAPPLLRWVRRMLRELRPSIHLLLETRAFDEADALANLIRQLAQGQEPPELAPTLEGLASKISLQYGFLPSDPRAVQLEASYRQMLETDTSSYWRTLTDPATLAGHIVEAKNAGLSLEAIAKQVSNTYRANYPASTRLVRTLYNAGANRAQLEALRASGYTHKQWLATPGPRTRPAHAQANRQVKPLEQPFVVGGYNLMYPGDRSLGAPAGMIVNCRCTLVGVGQPQPTEQERARQGVHFDQVTTTVSAAVRDTVLRGAQRAGFLKYLEHSPIPEVRMVGRILPAPGENGFISGDYDPRTQIIRVSAERRRAKPHPKLSEALWGQIERLSDVALSIPVKMQKTFVHELSHHLLWEWSRQLGSIVDVEARIRPVYKVGNPASIRGLADWKEYFCETHVAYVYHRALLKKLDPRGYAIVEEVRKALGIGVLP